MEQTIKDTLFFCQLLQEKSIEMQDESSKIQEKVALLWNEIEQIHLETLKIDEWISKTTEENLIAVVFLKTHENTI